MKSAIWISFDFGVRGDYEGMFTWFDEHKAKECGSNLAFLLYEYKKDLIKELKADLKNALDITKRTRIYSIHLDPERKKMKGTWLYGGRKTPPWTGFAQGPQEEDEDEAQ